MFHGLVAKPRRKDKADLSLDDKFLETLSRFFDLCKDERYIEPALMYVAVTASTVTAAVDISGFKGSIQHQDYLHWPRRNTFLGLDRVC